MNNIFCNNCGKTGHLYQKCRKPIISLGLIVVRFNPTIEFLLIRRRNTLGYVDFIRGKYSIDNIEYIKNLFNIMTKDEVNCIRNSNFNILWKELWRNDLDIYSSEYSSAEIKFDNIKNNLDKYISEDDKWLEPEWGFPKGRRNYLEQDYKCAIREWEEETGYSQSDIDIITNIMPINEIFLGSNNKAYKYKYYIGIMPNIKNINNNYSKNEISKVGWYKYTDAQNLIRNYSYEKLVILKSIYNLFQEYTIYK